MANTKLWTPRGIALAESQGRMRGQVITELTDLRGNPIRATRQRNTITNGHLGLVAQWMAGIDPNPPNYIALGTGAFAQYSESHKDTDIALHSSSTNMRLGQGFKATGVVTINSVLLWMKRTGTSAGSLAISIESDSAGVPSNTVLGISDNVAFNTVTTSYNWVRFLFSTPVVIAAATQYHLVLTSDGYTYSGGVTQIDCGADQSAPSYPDGVGTQWNGVVWAAIAPATDFVFRVTCLPDATFTALTDEGAGSRQILTSRSLQGDVSARLLVTYTAAQSVGYWNEAGLFNAASGPVMSAISVINVDKPNTNGLNVYWIIQVN